MRWIKRAVGLAACGFAALLLAPGCGHKDDPNTITTESGLKYVELEAGEGEAAKKGDLVAVHYTGKLRSGRQFDRSAEPFKFRLGARGVIDGWNEGIVGMKVGGRRKLVIPPKLGYGEKGFPPDIPPNAELIFEVELVAINPKEPEVQI